MLLASWTLTDARFQRTSDTLFLGCLVDRCKWKGENCSFPIEQVRFPSSKLQHRLTHSTLSIKLTPVAENVFITYKLLRAPANEDLLLQSPILHAVGWHGDAPGPGVARKDSQA